jgi:predicted TIM-barrel fold metal-dependent hydrolase
MGKQLVNSADSHVIEPPDLWLANMPPATRDRAPQTKVEFRKGREYEVIYVDGRPARYEPPGWQDDKTRPPGAYDPKLRMKDMEAEGIWAELLFPTVGMWIFLIQTRDVAMAAARTYNDWLCSHFMQVSPRFVGAAIVPLIDIDDAVAEIRRVARMGYKALMLPATPPVVAYNDLRYEPIWQAAAETAVWPAVHNGTGADPKVTRGPGGAIINYVETSFPLQRAALNLVAAGVFDRFPTMKLLCVEGGASWLPGLIERMEEAYRQHSGWVTPKLSRRPAEIIREHVRATFQHDRAFLDSLSVIGNDTVMWGSDYPHRESTWPHSAKVLDGIFAGVPTSIRDAVTGGTFARFFPASQAA